MALLLKIITVLFGLASIAAGVKSVLRREAKFTWNGDSDEKRVVEGIPAILIGLGEIAIGLYIIFALRFPFAS